MHKYVRIILAIYIISTIVGCANQSSKPKIVKNLCRYEITAENYDEVRTDCAGIIKAENAEEVIRLRNRDALQKAKTLAVPFEDIVLAAILNDKPERYCLHIFGRPPSNKLENSIKIEDELLDCSEKNIPRVTISNIEVTSDDGYRAYITFDCGLNGRCQSGWWVYVKEISTGKLILTNRKLDWIT